jgi:enoyl-CoA hydratase
VSEFQGYDPDDAAYRDEVYMELLEAVYESPLPIVVGVDGAAVGAGAIIASLCDIRVASPEGSFSIPEINVGIIGGMGPMRRVLPDGVARHMVYTGDPISAERAHELGMVSEIAEDAVERATELAGEIAENSPDALRAARGQIVERQPEWPLEEYRRERERIDDLRRLPNTDEAAAAFIENREPEFEEPTYEP